MKRPQQAKYIGSNPLYKDETAFVRDSDTPGVFLVQFDDMEKHHDLALGWHPFPSTDWQYTHTECNHCLKPMNGEDPIWSGSCSSNCAGVADDIQGNEETIASVYVVEVETGSSEQGQAMLFDSVWSTREKAEEYCSTRFKACGAFGTSWEYSITEVKLDTGA